ncbi:MAG TPA: hypothetical protein VJP60_06075 [Rhizomicrobium sp.]|nr:hypothetical protein [Rhizomicrobium sp.]
MTRILRLSLAAAALILAGSDPGHAACQCACVDGQVQTVCQNAIDLKPICSPQICQLVPPSLRPIQAPTIPPIGTSSCAPQQVFNPSTRLYEWRTLCR